MTVQHEDLLIRPAAALEHGASFTPVFLYELILHWLEDNNRSPQHNTETIATADLHI